MINQQLSFVSVWYCIWYGKSPTTNVYSSNILKSYVSFRHMCKQAMDSSSNRWRNLGFVYSFVNFHPIDLKKRAMLSPDLLPSSAPAIRTNCIYCIHEMIQAS